MLDRVKVQQDLNAYMERTKAERGSDLGYAWSAGYFLSTLGDALEELSKHDPHRAEQILNRFNA